MRLSILHRVTAVLSSLLLLQLSLVASGSVCRMHAGAEMSMEGSTAMGHDANMRAAMHRASGLQISTTIAGSNSSPGGCDVAGTRKSCDAPWVPASCASMTTCATTVSAVIDSGALLLQSSTPAAQAAQATAMPLGPAFAPEIPPPRA